MYHILVPDEEVHQLVTLIGADHVPKPHERFPQSFETFHGIPRGIPDKDTPLVGSSRFVFIAYQSGVLEYHDS